MTELMRCTQKDIESFIERTFETFERFSSVEAAAVTLAKGMCEEFGSAESSDLVLSRVFHSFDYELLPPKIQEVAARALGSTPADNSKFLVLIGTHGDKTDWQQRTSSQGHQAIPLNRNTVTSIPMVARLFQQVGFDLGIVLGEKQTGMDISGVYGSYGVFHVPEALGSPFIPAQDFVRDNGVRSVIGTGVMLPEGDIGIYLAFSRVPVSYDAAKRLSALMPLFWKKIYMLREKGMF